MHLHELLLLHIAGIFLNTSVYQWWKSTEVFIDSFFWEQDHAWNILFKKSYKQNSSVKDGGIYKKPLQKNKCLSSHKMLLQVRISSPSFCT